MRTRGRGSKNERHQWMPPQAMATAEETRGGDQTFPGLPREFAVCDCIQVDDEHLLNLQREITCLI